MNKRIAAFLTVFGLAALPSVMDAASSPATVTMQAMSASGQSGMAKISRTGGRHINVTIDLNGEPPGASEPVMIHAGSCADLKTGSQTVLNPVVEGRSVTTFTAPAYNPGTHAIVVHKSAKDMNSIVSCGDVDIL